MRASRELGHLLESAHRHPTIAGALRLALQQHEGRALGGHGDELGSRSRANLWQG